MPCHGSQGTIALGQCSQSSKTLLSTFRYWQKTRDLQERELMAVPNTPRPAAVSNTPWPAAVPNTGRRWCQTPPWPAAVQNVCLVYAASLDDELCSIIAPSRHLSASAPHTDVGARATFWHVGSSASQWTKVTNMSRLKAP